MKVDCYYFRPTISSGRTVWKAGEDPDCGTSQSSLRPLADFSQTWDQEGKLTNILLDLRLPTTSQRSLNLFI